MGGVRRMTTNEEKTLSDLLVCQSDTLACLQEGSETAGRLLQAGRIQAAMDVMSELAVGLQAACEMQQFLDQMGRGSPTGNTLPELAETITNRISQGDLVLVADLARYELPNLLAMWRQELLTSIPS